MRNAMAWLGGLTCLAALQASAQGSGQRVTASETASGGFMIRGPVVFSDYYEDGSGHVTVDARQGPGGTATGKVRAELRIGADSYRVELDATAMDTAVALVKLA